MKNYIIATIYVFVSVSFLSMECIVEWEKYLFKKSQTHLLSDFSPPQKSLVKKTGVVTVIVMTVVVTHLWLRMEFFNGTQSPTFIVIKVRLLLSFLLIFYVLT